MILLFLFNTFLVGTNVGIEPVERSFLEQREFPKIKVPKGSPLKAIHLELKGVYVPQGFDSNDVPQFVVEVEIPDSRLYVLPAEPKVDRRKKRIDFDLIAVDYPQVGIPILKSKKVEIKFKEILDSGTYSIFYHENKLPVGEMPITLVKAENLLKRDDFPYAPVERAKIIHNNMGKHFLHIEGKLKALEGENRDSCFVFDNERTRIKKTADNVIEVLPVLKLEKVATGKCENKDQDYSKDIPVPEDIPLKKRYLFHTRSDDGDANNLIETLF